MCLENYIQLFGSGLTFIVKAWAGLRQAVSSTMFIQGKNVLYFTLSLADEHREKRVSYQRVHLAFCAGSATAPAGQGKRAQPGQGTTLPDEHVAVISKGRRKESLPAPAAVICKKIKGIQFYSSTNPSREVWNLSPNTNDSTCPFPLDFSPSLQGETTTQDQRGATEAVF